MGSPMTRKLSVSLRRVFVPFWEENLPFSIELELPSLLHGSRHGWERLKWLVDINDYPMTN
jgi:hypothetical protein